MYFLSAVFGKYKKLHLAPLSRLHATVFSPLSFYPVYLFTKEGGSGSWKNLPIFFDGKRRGGSHKGRNFYWTTFLPSFIAAAIWLTNDGASCAKAGFPNRKRRKKTFSVYRTITYKIAVWDESETSLLFFKHLHISRFPEFSRLQQQNTDSWFFFLVLPWKHAMRENERGDFFCALQSRCCWFFLVFPLHLASPHLPIYWIVVTHALCYLNSGTRVFPHTKKRHKFALKMVIRLTRRLVCPSVHTCTRKTQKSMLQQLTEKRRTLSLITTQPKSKKNRC